MSDQSSKKRSKGLLKHFRDFVFRQRAPRELPGKENYPGKRITREEDITLRSLKEKYLQGRDVSEGYGEQMDNAINQFCRFIGREAMVSDLDRHTVNAWIEYLCDTKGSRFTVRTLRGHLLCLWNEAWRDGLLDDGIHRVRKVKATLQNPECWTEDDCNRILKQAGQLKGYLPSGIPASVYWTAIIFVAWDTALRRGDIAGLRRSDINEGRLMVTQHKTGGRVNCPLSEATQRAIDRTFDFNPQRELIFPWAFNDRQLNLYLKNKILKPLGLPGSFKWFRRSSATAVELAFPGTAQHHLGHKTPDIAFRHYVDLNRLQSNRKLPPGLNGHNNGLETGNGAS